MRNLAQIAILSVFLTACSVETMKVGEGQQSPAPEDKEPISEEGPTGGEGAEPSDEEDSGVNVKVKTTTTTTTEVQVGSGGGSGDAEGSGSEFRLVNKNDAVGTFVSQNFCRGSALNDCWIKSGTLKDLGDGSYTLSIEFWETRNTSEPYKVLESKITGESAVLLTDWAKIPEDVGLHYKMLWAVVDPVALTLDVVYDWAGDGPQSQGDDILQTLEFTE